ncbi:MAG: PQQ-binding-like beta-propeller repeat protein [Chthoniobacteraceae bacterium]
MTSTKFLLAAALLTFNLHAEENWPQFRGPNGDGRSDAKSLPTELGEGVHVKWKTPTHGKAWSSPVIWGNEIWLTTATEDGKELGVMAFDKTTGKVLHDKVLFKVAEPQFCHKFNSYASPTPVIEDGKLYASWGAPAIACIDTKTCAVLWERRDFVCNHFRGAGSSPIIWNGLMFYPFDGSDHQFIVALDKKTGKTVWEDKRSVDYKDLQPDGKPEADGDWRKAFGTPHVIEWKGKPLLLSSGAKAHYAYEPATGKEVWRFGQEGVHSASSRPVIGHGMWFLTPGFGKKNQMMALKLGGSGELDESSVAWRAAKAAPTKPSLLLDGDYIYAVDDKGIAWCIEAKTGEVKWSERIGGDYSASPLLAGGKLYFFSENGVVTVVAAAPEFKKLGGGKFDDGFMAAPAVSGKALFLRTRTALYRVEE